MHIKVSISDPKNQVKYGRAVCELKLRSLYYWYWFYIQVICATIYGVKRRYGFQRPSNYVKMCWRFESYNLNNLSFTVQCCIYFTNAPHRLWLPPHADLVHTICKLNLIIWISCTRFYTFHLFPSRTIIQNVYNMHISPFLLYNDDFFVLPVSVMSFNFSPHACMHHAYIPDTRV